MRRYQTTSKLFPNDTMGYDFTEYMTEVGNYYYETVVNHDLNTVTVTVSLSSEAAPF